MTEKPPSTNIQSLMHHKPVNAKEALISTKEKLAHLMARSEQSSSGGKGQASSSSSSGSPEVVLLAGAHREEATPDRSRNATSPAESNPQANPGLLASLSSTLAKPWSSLTSLFRKSPEIATTAPIATKNHPSLSSALGVSFSTPPQATATSSLSRLPVVEAPEIEAVVTNNKAAAFPAPAASLAKFVAPVAVPPQPIAIVATKEEPVAVAPAPAVQTQNRETSKTLAMLKQKYEESRVHQRKRLEELRHLQTFSSNVGSQTQSLLSNGSSSSPATTESPQEPTAHIEESVTTFSVPTESMSSVENAPVNVPVPEESAPQPEPQVEEDPVDSPMPLAAPEEPVEPVEPVAVETLNVQSALEKMGAVGEKSEPAVATAADTLNAATVKTKLANVLSKGTANAPAANSRLLEEQKRKQREEELKSSWHQKEEERKAKQLNLQKKRQELIDAQKQKSLEEENRRKAAMTEVEMISDLIVLISKADFLCLQQKTKPPVSSLGAVKPKPLLLAGPHSAQPPTAPAQPSRVGLAAPKVFSNLPNKPPVAGAKSTAATTQLPKPAFPPPPPPVAKAAVQTTPQAETGGSATKKMPGTPQYEISDKG